MEGRLFVYRGAVVLFEPDATTRRYCHERMPFDMLSESPQKSLGTADAHKKCHAVPVGETCSVLLLSNWRVAADCCQGGGARCTKSNYTGFIRHEIARSSGGETSCDQGRCG